MLAVREGISHILNEAGRGIRIDTDVVLPILPIGDKGHTIKNNK